MDSISISKKIYDILSSNDELTNIVGDKIYPLIAESNTSYPFVVFKRNQIVPEYTKDWLTNENIQMEIVSASNKYFETIDVATVVRKILEGYKDKDIIEVKVNFITEDFIDDCYTQRITFNIII